MRVYLSLFFLLFSLSVKSEYSSFYNYKDPFDELSLHGWHGPMEELKKKLNPNKNYAIAILHNPVNAFLFQDILWFRNTVVAARKKLKDNPHGQLGHFQVAWSCKLPGSKRRYGMTGQSGEVTYQGADMLLNMGYGMSIFFANFTDGFLQSSQGSSHRIEQAPDLHGFTWVAFEISEKDCDQGLYFLDEYIKSKAYENFSFVKDPNKLEGGGCTSFASELLFQFGAFRGTLINAWKTDLLIPRSFLANPAESILPENTELPEFLHENRYTRRKADLFAMSFLPTFSPKKTRIAANIYDTELITYSLQGMIRRAFNEKPSLFPQGFKQPRRRAYGLKWEDGNLRPGGRKSFVEVDDSLGFYFQRLTNYINHKDIKLPKFSYEELNGQPGVVFDRAAW